LGGGGAGGVCVGVEQHTGVRTTERKLRLGIREQQEGGRKRENKRKDKKEKGMERGQS